MYCTGGIRCERASALLDALARTSDGKFAVQDTVMVRGGIERYMKTFPEGGYWKGKNYLFDRRQEQVPEAKSGAALAAEAEMAQEGETLRGEHLALALIAPPVDKIHDVQEFELKVLAFTSFFFLPCLFFLQNHDKVNQQIIARHQLLNKFLLKLSFSLQM